MEELSDMSGRFVKIDLHMHTTVSDGTDHPEDIPELIRKAGIEIFSVTDHDAVKAAGIINGTIRDDGPRFIAGIEFSCRDEEGKYHILGYGIAPDDPELNGVLKRGHDYRMNKVMSRLEHLKKDQGIAFPDDEIKKLLSLDNPGKPHIANLMVRYGYAETKEQAFRDYLNIISFESEYIRPEEAVQGIISAGGIPVLAHPFYGSGDELILGLEMTHRIHRLIGFGIRGIEAFYSGFTDKLINEALILADQNGLLVTAGSDYHGSNKLVQLGNTGLERHNGYPTGLRRFLEIFGL